MIHTDHREQARMHKQLLWTAFSFFIPFFVLFLAIIALHITPFGDKHSLAITDAKYYLNGQMNWARLLRGEENWLYSFNNGLGGNNWSGIAWGTINIGSFLSLLAKLETIPSVFTWICVVNLSICGLTMYILLSYLRSHQISNLIFSTCYALIGFNVVNCYQTGFLLGPEMLPLVTLGLIMLLKRNNPLLYIISLAFCTFCNFYFAFHLCVFSFLFFLAYMYVHSFDLKEKKKSISFYWFIASVIGGLLAAPMWLPALKAYSGGGRLDQTTLSEYSFRENMPFIQIFAKLFTGANSTDELVLGLPNIFCGILVLALVVLYYTNKRIDIKRKRAAGAILCIYLLSFYIPAFTILMHGGTHTNWFPYRYSYVFSFILIGLAAEEFGYVLEITIEDTKRCGRILIIATIIVFGFSYNFISGGDVLLDLLLLSLMWLGFWFFKTRPNKAPLRTFSLLLLILVCINQYANFIISTQKVQEWELDLDEYNKNIISSGALVDAVNAYEESFFRMEKDFSESNSIGADPLLYNYNGVSHSGPTERMFVHQQLNRLGVNWFDMRHWYSEGVPEATDVLLGLKYIIAKRDLTKEKGYENKVSIEDCSLFFNPDALSVSILAGNDVQKIELGEDPFENLNSVWKMITGEADDVFYKQGHVTYFLFNDYSNQSVTSEELTESVAKAGSETEEQNSGSSEYRELSSSEIIGRGDSESDEPESSSYMKYSFIAERDGSIYVFDTSIPDSPQGLPNPSIKYVGTYRKGDKVEGKFPITSGIGSGDMLRGYCVNQVFAYADDETLAKYAKLVNDRDITFDVIHENDLTGMFTAKENQRILFTIPWDEGWTCYIDGQKVPIDKTWDLFMSVSAPEGKHTYEMKFFPAWMNYGIYLSISALVGLIVLLWLYKKKKVYAISATGEGALCNASNDTSLEKQEETMK